MINRFAQFYRVKVVFLKAFSKALELLQGLCCGQSLGKVELSLVKGITLISRTLNRMLPICCESLFLSEVQGFPQILFPRAPLWVRTYSQHTLGNTAYPSHLPAPLDFSLLRTGVFLLLPSVLRSAPSFPEPHLQHSRYHEEYNYPGNRGMDFTLHYVDPA